MDSQPWLDRVRQRLAKHALPPSYVQRFMEELADHLNDLKEENMEADAISRLGEAEQVAEAAVVAYRRRSFLGRHPTAAFLVFAVSPVILWLFVWSAFACLALDLNTSKTDRGIWLYIEHHWLCSLIAAVCSTIAGTFYGELAVWLGIGRKWTLASYAAIGAIAMYLEFGLGLGTVTVTLPAQFAVPFAVGWWFIKRRCEQKYAGTKVLVFAISPVLALLILSNVVILALHPVQEWIEHEQYKQWTAQSDAPMRFSPAALEAAWYASYLLRHSHPNGLGQPPLLQTCEGVRLGQKVDIHPVYGDCYLRSDEPLPYRNVLAEAAQRLFDSLDDVQDPG